MAEGGDGESYGDKMARIMREMVEERQAAGSAPSPTPGSSASLTSSASNSPAEALRKSPSAAFGLLRSAGHGLLGTAGRGAVRRESNSSQAGVPFVTEITRKVG